MGQKFITFLCKETKTLNQAALLLGLFAFLSQVLAFLRDRLLAHIFGASAELDIYYAAFRIPDFIFITVASVVSLSVLIPFIIEREVNGSEAVRDFVSNIFSFFSGLIIVVSVIVFFLMPTLSGLLFKSFSASALSDVVFISRILLLSPIILGFSNLFGSLTQAYNRFTIYALAPILYNAGIIVGIIFLTKNLGVMGVAWGVVLGAFLHMLVQIPFILNARLFPRFKTKLDFEVISRVVKISLPRTLTLSMSSLGLLFLVSLASFMTTGSISIFSFSLNLQSVPIAIIGVSYSLAAFPTLSRHFKNKNLEFFVQQMATTARFIIFWSLPVTALFIVLRAQIVRVILGTGLFDWNDTRLTAAALALFVVSAMFQSLVLLFIRGFYSAGFTRKPLFLNLISTIIMIVGAWVLVKVFYLYESFQFFVSSLLKVDDLSGTAVLMLPLGYSIATIFNGLIHWVAFEREFRGFSNGIVRTFFQSVSASMIIGATAYLGLNIFAPLFGTTSLVGIFLQGFLAGIIAIVVGIGVLALLRSKELIDVWFVIKSKFWKAKVIATDPEIV